MGRTEEFGEAVKTRYAETITEASDIISHAQIPLAALSIITALLIYMAGGAKDFPSLKAYIDILLAGFYLSLITTFFLVGLSCFYLVCVFKAGGYTRDFIGPIESFHSKYEDKTVTEEALLGEILKSYMQAVKNNRPQNDKRREYVRKSMETIIRAVVCCLITGAWYWVITIFPR